MGQRFYRVVESPRFLEHLYPILSAQPTGMTGGAPLVYERPFFSIELRSEGGWWGVVIYVADHAALMPDRC